MVNRSIARIAISLTSMAFLAGPTLAKAARVAFVIGNDTYLHVVHLQNARNDARLIAGTLRDAGFEIVGGVQEDLDRTSMGHALDQLEHRVVAGDEVVFYYAGHGVQIDATDMLLPVDIEAESGVQVVRDGINLNDIQVAVKGARFALIVIDACRDNPFPPRPDGTRGIGGATRGLSRVEAVRGTVIVMSAGFQQTALDIVPNVTKKNGLFTYELAKAIKSPGVDIMDALHQARDRIEDAARLVDHQQLPTISEEIRGKYYLFPEPTRTEPYTATAPETATGAHTSATPPWIFRLPQDTIRAGAHGGATREGAASQIQVEFSQSEPLNCTSEWRVTPAPDSADTLAKAPGFRPIVTAIGETELFFVRARQRLYSCKDGMTAYSDHPDQHQGWLQTGLQGTQATQDDLRALSTRLDVVQDALVKNHAWFGTDKGKAQAVISDLKVQLAMSQAQLTSLSTTLTEAMFGKPN